MQPSWDLIRSFQSVAELGSLSAASRALSVTQPTIGRHIDQLEQDLKLALFLRDRDGMHLTEAGRKLVSASQEMAASAEDFARRATGMDEEVTGTVRISANEIFGMMVLPGILGKLLADLQNIEVELVVSNAASNLLKRDADIAIRMFRPTQNDLVARKIADIPLGLYAHRSYLNRCGRPQKLAELKAHVFLGFDRETGILDACKALGEPFELSDFRFRSDSIMTHIAGIKSGAGIGITHQQLAQHWPEVERVLPDLDLPTLELWIACHADVRFNRRIRLVMDFLAEQLQRPYGATLV